MHPSPPKFSVDVPFFADEPFKCGLFGRSNQNQQAKYEQVKIKLSTLKRSQFFVQFITFKEQVDKLNLVELANQFCIEKEHYFYIFGKFKSRDFPRKFIKNASVRTQTSYQSSLLLIKFIASVQKSLHQMFGLCFFTLAHLCFSHNTLPCFIVVGCNCRGGVVKFV